MTHPTEDELADLATQGDAYPVTEVIAHVAACHRCSSDVAGIQHVITEIRSGLDREGDWITPPSHVWESVAAELDREHLEDLATPARLESRAGPTPSTGTRPSRSRVWRIVGVTAASLLCGLAAGRALSNIGTEPVVSVVATVDMKTLDGKRTEGSAVLERTGAQLDLRLKSTQTLQPQDGYLEVWLINRDLTRMVSVGILSDGQSGVFPVAQDLLDRGYDIVDVSREAFDDKPQHSGVSLLRGQLPS